MERNSDETSAQQGWHPTAKLIALTLIIAIGAFLRLYRLDVLPPGDSHDPAQYGVDALEILAGARPIFLPTNFGREALFSYLVAAVYKITGAGTFGIHLTAALIGILTIPATYLAADELFRRHEGVVRQADALLAALVMSLSYWHLNWSRVGLRAILVPLFASMIVYHFWRGRRLDKWGHFVACGVWLGGSLYTYQAARLLPVLVLAAFGIVAIAERKETPLRQTIKQALVTAGVAAVVFAPLGYYSWTHPGALNERLNEALILSEAQTPAEQIAAVQTQVIKSLRMFFIEGDGDPLFTIPGRPSLNPFLAAGLILGLLYSVVHLLRPRLLFLLSWLAVMTAPALIASQASTAKRAIGALPAVAILIALGLLIPLNFLMRQARQRPQTSWRAAQLVVTAALGLGLLYTAINTYRDYFVRWPTEEDLVTHFQIGRQLVGEFIGQQGRDTAVYLSPLQPTHPTIQLHSGLHPNVRGYNGRHCLVVPKRAETDITYVIVPDESEVSLAMLESYFPNGRLIVTGPELSQRPTYIAYRVPAGASPQISPQHVVQSQWSDSIRLLGYDLIQEPHHPGEMLELRLYYETLAPMSQDHTAFVHLIGPPNPETGSPLWAQADSQPCQGTYPTGIWQPGEIIIDTVRLHVPEWSPPDTYELQTGLYTWPELIRLPVLSLNSQSEGNSLTLQLLPLQ